jgi:hypothetical protein
MNTLLFKAHVIICTLLQILACIVLLEIPFKTPGSAVVQEIQIRAGLHVDSAVTNKEKEWHCGGGGAGDPFESQFRGRPMGLSGRGAGLRRMMAVVMS